MRLTRLIVLANSRKQGNRCLAGIDLATGKWVRPICKNEEDGSIPLKTMQRAGCVPELLDLLEMPLDAKGPDYGFENENRTILPGKWRWLEKISIADIKAFAITPSQILHSDGNSVAPEVLQAKPFTERITLQLIHTDAFTVREEWREFKRNWIGCMPVGKVRTEFKITDPVFCEKLRTGHRPSPSCLLTMSLSMPFSPASGRPSVCWKLIAGVIELGEKP